jgi:hypothetical protein
VLAAVAVDVAVESAVVSEADVANSVVSATDNVARTPALAALTNVKVEARTTAVDAVVETVVEFAATVEATLAVT